jgi:parallel beta-helix repeat protein
LKGLLLTCALVLIAAPYTVAASNVVHIADDITAPEGYDVTVPIMIYDATGVGSIDVTLSYNASVVNVTDATEGDFTWSFAFNNTNAANGWITIITAVHLQNLTGSVKVADVTLKAVGNPGDSSPLNLEINVIADQHAHDLTGTTDDGSFIVSPVQNLNTSEGFSTIQAAIFDSDTKDTHIITVYPGTYNENVVVSKSLTIRSTSGNPMNTKVVAANPNEHVFEVTAANHVSITGFTMTGATGGMKAGIYLGGVNHCDITNNAVLNNKIGIYLSDADNNDISCNWVQNSMDRGFYLSGGSTGNSINSNNIIANGNHNATSDGWEWNLYNGQSDAVAAGDNYWGTNTETIIAAGIKKDTGSVGYVPFATGPVPCAPIPELPTIVLFSVGLIALAGYARRW